jgi:hypothetical protein
MPDALDLRALDLPCTPRRGGRHLELRFTLPAPGAARLRIYDAAGRLVRTLLDRPHLSWGTHGVHWDLRDEGGNAVAGGVYFCALETRQSTGEGHRLVRKVSVVR